MTTFKSLHDCVGHAATMGHIDNAGMAQSLLAKVEAAQAAYARGQSDMAIQIVQSFIDEVRAQSGQHMDDDHAGHMMAHAQMVIDHLNGIR